MNTQSSELFRILESTGKAVQEFADIIAPHLEPVARGFVALAEWHKMSEVLNAAGWLPHYTTPLALVADCSIDADAVRTKLKEYYEQNWSSVRRDIESHLAEYNVDEEARATFREALDAHGHGLHRSACRVVFPEIDRLLRTELFGHRTGNERYPDIVKSLVCDKEKSLEDFLPGGWFDFDYMGHLTAGIIKGSDDAVSEKIFGVFRKVTEGDLQRLEQDPVPNRHAAMHGYVPYSSQQNSLNTIFVGDYIFRLIGSFRDVQSSGNQAENNLTV